MLTLSLRLAVCRRDIPAPICRADKLVRAVIRQGIARGCETYIIREGWEGLVRGNTHSEATPAATPFAASAVASPVLKATSAKNVSFSSLPPSQQLSLDAADDKLLGAHSVDPRDPDAVAPLSDAPLSFGYGELLKDGAGEGDLDAMTEQAGLPDSFLGNKQDASGRSLKGKYIVRVGWDDVRGWLGEGGTLIGSSRCPSCE